MRQPTCALILVAIFALGFTTSDRASAFAQAYASIIPFIKARGVAIVGSDDASEVTPSMVEGIGLPVHTLLITALGVNILDNQDLEAVAEVAAKLKRWEFMIAINPLAVTGGTGSPMNTLAIF